MKLSSKIKKDKKKRKNQTKFFITKNIVHAHKNCPTILEFFNISTTNLLKKKFKNFL